MGNFGIAVPGGQYSQFNTSSDQFRLDNLPPEIALDEQALNRRQQIANLLLSRGLAPMPQGQMVGRFYVPPSWAQGLANLGQVAAGALLTRGNEQEREQLARQHQQMTQDAVRKYLEGTQGIPAAAVPEGSQGPERPEIPPTEQSKRAAIVQAMTSQIPGLQQLATMELQQKNKPLTHVDLGDKIGLYQGTQLIGTLPKSATPGEQLAAERHKNEPVAVETVDDKGNPITKYVPRSSLMQGTEAQKPVKQETVTTTDEQGRPVTITRNPYQPMGALPQPVTPQAITTTGQGGQPVTAFVNPYAQAGTLPQPIKPERVTTVGPRGEPAEAFVNPYAQTNQPPIPGPMKQEPITTAGPGGMPQTTMVNPYAPPATLPQPIKQEPITTVNKAGETVTQMVSPSYVPQPPPMGVLGQTQPGPAAPVTYPKPLEGETGQLVALMRQRDALPPGSKDRKVYEDAINKLVTHQPTTEVKIQNYEPADIQLQKDLAKKLADRYEKYAEIPAQLENLEKAKTLIGKSGSFVGAFGEKKMEIAKFFNNNFGTTINAEEVANAGELGTRIFQNILDNLKKMDAQPSEQQQIIMQKALGSLNSDPTALVRMLDAYGDNLRNKVALHNKAVADIEKPRAGNIPKVHIPYDITIHVPPKVTAPAAPPSGGSVAPFNDPEKERRYQEWKKQHK